MRILAFDIGAESGRGIVGDLRGDKLTLTEVRRFPNGGVREGDSLHWDAPGLWGEMKQGMRAAAQGGAVDSVGVDTWGVDYALIDERGELLGNPHCYRDHRTDGVMAKLCASIGRDEIFNHTGIQFLPFNTLYQMAVEREQNPARIGAARRCLMMPDLFHYWMTGVAANEYTEATTTQLFNTRTGRWSNELLKAIGASVSLFADVKMPGSSLGKLLPSVAEETGLSSARVTLPGSHDTASAVAAVPFEGKGLRAYISSGTWSLVGVEMAKPVINAQSLAANVTNEGGVGGKIRLLRNVMGLWLIQRCRAEWAREGNDFSYEELARLAGEVKSFNSVVNPDDESLLNPADMRAAIVNLCKVKNQKLPQTPGEFSRCIYLSLALAYRDTVEQIEKLAGQKIEAIHVVGGGSRNSLLNQLTADVCGRPVFSGAVECTAIGNILTQAMGVGELASLEEIRAVVRKSFEIEVFKPRSSQ